MSHIFINIIYQYVLAYFNGILVHSEISDDHEKYLHKVFSRLPAYQL